MLLFKVGDFPIKYRMSHDLSVERWASERHSQATYSLLSPNSHLPSLILIDGHRCRVKHQSGTHTAPNAHAAARRNGERKSSENIHFQIVSKYISISLQSELFGLFKYSKGFKDFLFAYTLFKENPYGYGLAGRGYQL